MDNAQHENSSVVRFLDKEMGKDEQSAFESTLSSDEQMRAELESLQLTRQAVIMYGIKQQVSTIHAEERKANSTEAPVIKMNPYKKIIRYAVAAAACTILIIMGVNRYNYSKLSADTLYAEQFSNFEPSNNRGSTTEPTAIEKAYLDKDYKQVTGLYQSAPVTDQKQLIMTGVSYLETNQPTQAINIFQALLENNRKANTTSFNDDASWYLALSFLKNKNYAQAIELMKKIQADKENPYHIKFTEAYIQRVEKLSSR